MKLSFFVHPMLDGRPVDPHVLVLLDALAEHKSLAAAARATSVSYRFAWDRLRQAENLYGEPLVRMQRGRGASLEALAATLLQARARASRSTAATLASVARGFDQRLSAGEGAPEAVRLRCVASHDLAMIALKSHAESTRPALEIDLRFRGSLEALSEFVRGRCDLAGFHIAPRIGAADQLTRRLSSRRHCLVVLGERSQGLMVAPDNPKRITGVADLARRGVRVVNRQPGSGTRLLFDRLLAAAKVDHAQIRGYQTEEFTHLAVAATVASAHADAGFGIQAAAEQYGLQFLPISQEIYYLAMNRAQLDCTAGSRLIEIMRRPALKRRLGRLAGYRLDACGQVLSVEDALR